MADVAAKPRSLDAAFGAFVEWVDRGCGRLEARCGLPAAALILGILLLGLAAVWSTPSLKPVAHGVLFARLLFWCFACPDRPVLGAFLYALALFTHECALFALPWLVLPADGRRLASRRTLLKLAFCGLAVALLLLWRDWVASQVVVRFS